MVRPVAGRWCLKSSECSRFAWCAVCGVRSVLTSSLETNFMCSCVIFSSKKNSVWDWTPSSQLPAPCNYKLQYHLHVESTTSTTTITMFGLEYSVLRVLRTTVCHTGTCTLYFIQYTVLRTLVLCTWRMYAYAKDAFCLCCFYSVTVCMHYMNVCSSV